jgi:hypothetical protein
MLPLHAPVHSTFARLLRALLAVALPILLLTGCVSEEKKRMDALAGNYVRTFREGVAPVLGLDGTVERHVLMLTADGRYRTSHPVPSMQQFDVPMDSGTYRVDGVNLVLRSDDLEEGDIMPYTISGDTLFPRTSNRMRMGEMVTGYSMGVGEKTYLLRAR